MVSKMRNPVLQTIVGFECRLEADNRLAFTLRFPIIAIDYNFFREIEKRLSTLRLRVLNEHCPIVDS